MVGIFTAIANGEANLSIASLPLALFISGLPHWYSIYLAESNKVRGGWSNENPRAFVARLNAQAAAGKKLSALEEKILRGQAAQQNGFEWWAVWAVAVAFGYMTKLPSTEMNRYTYIYIGTRLVYNYLYLTTSSRIGSYMRTAVFQLTCYPAVAIFLKAATTLK